jgi:hypothetical protein
MRFGWLRRLAAIFLTAGAIASAAMAIPALILPVGGRAQSVFVLFSHSPDPGALPSRVTILAWQDHWARLDNVSAKAVRTLYAQGALFIMPIRKSGCLSLRKI